MKIATMTCKRSGATADVTLANSLTKMPAMEGRDALIPDHLHDALYPEDWDTDTFPIFVMANMVEKGRLENDDLRIDMEPGIATRQHCYRLIPSLKRVCYPVLTLDGRDLSG